MSIREKEELLRQAADKWTEAAEQHKLASEHLKAAEALRNAARALEKAEEVHPIGFINAIGRRAAEEQARKLGYDPEGQRIPNN